MDEPSLVILDRRRGRPRADEPKTSISAWIPTQEYDRLVRTAQQQEKSLSALVRDLLAMARRPR